MPLWDNEPQAPGVVWDAAPTAPASPGVVWDSAPATPAAAPSSFRGEMGAEAKRLLMLPGRTFMQGMQSGVEQWQKAAQGEPIDVLGYKLPAAVSAPLRAAYGLLEGVNAPITAATRMVTDPATRLLQSATGISEPTREMVQGMGDVALGVFGPAGVAKLREVPGAFKPAPPSRARPAEPTADAVIWDDAASIPASATRAAKVEVVAPAVVEASPAVRMAEEIPRPVEPLRVSEPAAVEAAIAKAPGVIWDDAAAAAKPLEEVATAAAPGPDIAGTLASVVDQAGRINPQTLSSLAGSVTGGVGGFAMGDTPQERIALGLTGATLGGIAGRQAGKLFAREAVPVAKAAETLAPAPAEARPFGALENVLGMPLTESRVATPLTGAIANAADAAVIPRIAAGPQQRLFRHVQDALASGEIAPETLPGLLERHGVTAVDFARDYAQTVSDSGRTLAQLSHLRRRIEGVLAHEPEAAKILATLPEAPVPAFSRAMEIYRKVDDQRRALLVSQWATSARNGITQAARLGLDSVDTAISSALGGESAVKSLQAGLDNFAAVARRMTPAGRDRLAGIMDEFPLDAAKLSGTISGEAALGSKISSFINPLNAAQEGFFRKVAFDAKLSTLARERGVNLEQLSPGQIPGDMIQQATKHALEVTFASTPQAGTFGAALLNAYRELPILTTINPFPRFFGNALKFLYEFSPLGITKLLTPAAERTLASGNPAAASQVISRAGLGTGMLAAAVAIRASDIGGEKWYELKVPGSDQRLDTRAFGPFNMYLLFAEGMVHPERLTVADWAKGLVGINRVAGTGLVVTDALTSGSADQKMERFKTFVGSYLGGFSVPARNFKAMIEGGLSGSPDVAERESLYRDMRESPVTGPFLTNLPGVSQQFPAMVSSTSSAPIRNENPLLRQLTGVSMRTKNEAQQMIDTIGIEPTQVQPASGIPAWDRAVATPLGPVVEKLLPAISQAPGYRDLPPALQRYLVRQALTEGRKAIMPTATAAHPELAAQAALKGLDPDLRTHAGLTRKGQPQAPGVYDSLLRMLEMAK